MGKLTVRQIEAAKATGKRYELSDGDGLKLRVSPDGSRTWYVRFTVNGKQDAARLARPWGKETDSGHLSLEDARREAQTILAKAREGIDYRTERKAQIEQARATTERERSENLDARSLYEAWIADGIDHADGGKELRRRFEKDVMPIIGATPLRALIESDIRQVLRPIVKRGALRMAVSVRDSLIQMFAWGMKRLPWRRLLEVNPAASITDESIVGRDYEEGADTRALDANELPELRDKIEALKRAFDAAPDKRRCAKPLDKRTEHALWIMVSTMCRVGEITRARRADVDIKAGTWYIPPEHSKNGDAITVYLSDFAKHHFAALLALPHDGSRWLFPSLEKAGEHQGLKVITKKIGDRQLTVDQKQARAKRTSATDSLVLSGGRWTPHSLRYTGATIMESLGIMPAIVDRCLNHRERRERDGSRLSGSAAKLRRTYQRYDYAEEMREAWRMLGERLELLLRADREKVVVLTRA
ncbi:phage integrase [Burkholderia pseudomallei]|nr:phage integrase [Burkholderia pseudomallei]CAK0232772.1 phage integrase [Burkholderia pseudomallei]